MGSLTKEIVRALRTMLSALTFAFCMGIFIFVGALALGAAFALIRALWGFGCL